MAISKGIFKVHAPNINKPRSLSLKLGLLIMFAFAIDDVLECIQKISQARIKFSVLTVTKWIAINIGPTSKILKAQAQEATNGGVATTNTQDGEQE
ncbi:hypothetical protein ZWY2020_014629 [Hordeum vulgare]|nr:hypothetical protein ZWY2020_014629 [Hordeum vulgare]